jgi:RNA polymerase sigma-70 factor, ECF subfamily
VTALAWAEVLRRYYPSVLAKTLAMTRALPDAEDAVHDAIARALESWPRQGLPDAPEAWLVTVAANAFRDRMRRARREQPHQDALETLASMTPWAQSAMGDPQMARSWKDELLRLLFACCHPALDEGESAGLALATVIGLSTAEIAAAFAVSNRTMEQRLTRARQRLRERGDYDGAAPDRSLDRLGAVLRAIRLLYNEGYWSTDGEAPIRAELCRLALGLAHSTLEAFPEAPEAAGLLALLLFHEARRPARLDAAGAPVPLPDQDRNRWDGAAIAGAVTVLEGALARGRPGALQIEAAISATHCRAASAADTDWAEIAALYALLERFEPSPVVRVNRAFAVARASGPAAGMALLDGDLDTSSVPYAHLVRGVLLAELGRKVEARASLERAEQAARNPAERAQIRARLNESSDP